MPDYVDTTTLVLYRSKWPQPANTVELTRAEHDAAAAIPQIYRKWTGSAVEEMTQAEKDVVDAQILSDARDSTASNLDQVESLERAFALVVLDEINVLRAQHSLADRTISQLKTALRNKLGS